MSEAKEFIIDSLSTDHPARNPGDPKYNRQPETSEGEPASGEALADAKADVMPEFQDIAREGFAQLMQEPPSGLEYADSAKLTEAYQQTMTDTVFREVTKYGGSRGSGCDGGRRADLMSPPAAPPEHLIVVPIPKALLVLTREEYAAGIRRGKSWRRRQAMEQREATSPPPSVVASTGHPPDTP